MPLFAPPPHPHPHPHARGHRPYTFAHVAALLLAFAISCSANATAADTLRFCLAIEPNPPFSQKDAAGRWQGWEIELRDAVCGQMGATCEWVETGFDGLQAALAGKHCDVIWSSMAITPERRKAMAFTDKYYDLPLVVAGRKDLALTPTAAGLGGRNIGAAAGSAALDYARKHFAATARSIEADATEDDLDRDLASGKLDAGLADAITMQSFLDSEAGKACCKLLGAVAPDAAVLGEGIGAAVRKDDPALRERLNAAIKAVRASGGYAAITARYFAFDIYGN